MHVLAHNTVHTLVSGGIEAVREYNLATEALRARTLQQISKLDEEGSETGGQRSRQGVGSW
jgi:hypothetical protein